MADVIQGNSDSRPERRSPASWGRFWNKELAASEKMLRRWVKSANKTVKRYIDDRAEGEDTWFRLNLFHANVTTLMSMLYGSLPQVEVTRRFQDANDDVARVAALMLQRLLNNDIQEHGEEYSVVLRGVLEDRLVPGNGVARVRYEMESEEYSESVEVRNEDTGEMEAGEETRERMLWEDAPVQYHYWGDVRWSYCRNWSEMRWVAFRHHLTKEDMIRRFGSAKEGEIRYEKANPANDKTDSYDRDSTDSVDTAAIWEIWDKESDTVFWHQQDQMNILEQADDPLELEGFWPCPPFFMANNSTTLYRPTSDFYLAQDTYNEIDRLETRIAMITEAVKVVGVYDKSIDGVQRMLKEGIENDLVPVDNWAILAEKGGLKGVIGWFPVEEVARTLGDLVARRQDQIALLYQITGMSDILRGASSQSGVSATEQELKAKFSSVRVQALQDEFAHFASDLLQLKAEIICKHFEPQTILRQANVRGLAEADLQLIEPAIELLKNPEEMLFRVEIKPESVAMVDYAKKQQERTEYINTLGFFLQSAQPIVEMAPQATPTLLELLKWGLAGFKGSKEIEGVIDQAVEDLKRNPPQQQDDGEARKAEVEQMKAQAKLQELQMKMEHDSQKHQFEMRELGAKHEADMARLLADFQTKMAVLEAQVTGKVTEQSAQTEGKVIEQAHSTATKIEEMERAAEIQARSEDAETG